MAKKKYNPYEAVGNIASYKEQWEKGDSKSKTVAEENAREWYQELRNNGYGELANKLSNSNYQQAKEIADSYSTFGKSSFRPYLYGSKLATEFGMSKNEIDDLIGFNNRTNEITFGGKNIGVADTIYDGASYFDNDFLDGVVNDYIASNNLTPKSTANSNIRKLLGVQFDDHGKMSDLYKEAYDIAKNTNPFETETGKSIMAKYDLDALKGRDNEAARGAGDNGGNVDSFAAANALRQQTAITAQGQQVVLADQAQRVNNILAALSGMSGNNQADYAGMQTSIGLQADIENTKHQKDIDIAGVTGYVPADMERANNPYFNSDGTLKNVDTDYQAIINKANEELKTATDPQRINDLEATIRYANDARHYKVNNYEKYKKYTDTLMATSAVPTAQRENADAENALAQEKLANDYLLELAGLDQKNKEAQIKAKSGGTNGGMTGSQATTALKNGEVNEATIGAYNAAYGTNYTVDNPPAIAYSNLDEDQKPDVGTSKGEDLTWDAWYDEFENEKVKGFLTSYIKPYYDSSTLPDAGKLKDLILEKTEDYDIGVEDARKIMSVFGLDSTWLEGYRDRWGWNSKKGMTEK